MLQKDSGIILLRVSKFEIHLHCKFVLALVKFSVRGDDVRVPEEYLQMWLLNDIQTYL
jgi:hypothetical protein